MATQKNKTTAASVKVEVMTPYKDLQRNQVMELGDTFEVTAERAKVLLDRKLVKKL